MTLKRVYIAPYVVNPAPEPAASTWQRLLARLLRRGAESNEKRPAGEHYKKPTLRRPAPRAYRLLDQRTNEVHAAVPSIAADADESTTPVEYLMLEAIQPSQLRPGDYLLVEAGEWIEADGLVVEGEALIDASPATGESAAIVRSATGIREVMRNTQVIAGSIFVEVTPPLGHPLDW